MIVDKPTEVKLGIYVNSFYSISEQTMVSQDNGCHGYMHAIVVSCLSSVQDHIAVDYRTPRR